MRSTTVRLSIFLLLSILFVVGCEEAVNQVPDVMETSIATEEPIVDEPAVPATEEQKVTIPETVTFLSKDDVKIAASYYPGGSKGVILLHMLSSDRHSWDDFALQLHDEKYTVISIDLRGHGASDLNYKRFSFADFNNMAFDVEAAREFVEKKTHISKWYIMGASIGANIALKYAATADGVDMVALLSPGMEYRGVLSERYLLEMNRPVFFAVSAGDKYASESTETLFSRVDGKHHRTSFKKYAGNEHGTDMFKNTELEQELIDWLARS